VSVRVRLPSAIYRSAEVIVDVDAVTIEELLEILSEKTGKDLKRLMIRDGDLNPLVIVFVNGKNVRHDKGLKTTVKSGDEVSVVPAVAGG